MVTNATLAELQKALETVNQQYNNNIKLKTVKAISANRLQFTLGVIDSHKAGGRLSTMWLVQKNYGYDYGLKNPRHVAAACWHVHGDLFEALFLVNPNIFIRSHNKMITQDDGNWEDWNIGSIMYPVFYSQACHCDD